MCASRRPLAFGVLGCGDVARRRMLPALAVTPEATVAAVASRSAAKAAAVAARFATAAVCGYQPLLERGDVEAVYIAVPAALHAEWIRRALLAGKHVLAEKPLTTSCPVTAELVALARSLGLVLRENFTFVHHSRHEYVRALVADGGIGELRTFQATFAVPARPPGDIRLSAELGGGALLDIGGYPLRAAGFFLGTELEVVGAVLRPDVRHGVDAGGAVLARAPGGVTAQLTFGIDDQYLSEYRLTGSTGRISVEHAFTTPATLAPVVVLDRAGRSERRVRPAEDQWRAAIRAFTRACRSGGGDDRVITRQAALLDDAREAASSRGRLS
ncbi:Gfo/Idh/MocA family protein [Amycolatopsis sp. NPDC005003]